MPGVCMCGQRGRRVNVAAAHQRGESSKEQVIMVCGHAVDGSTGRGVEEQSVVGRRVDEVVSMASSTRLPVPRGPRNIVYLPSLRPRDR